MILNQEMKKCFVIGFGIPIDAMLQTGQLLWKSPKPLIVQHNPLCHNFWPSLRPLCSKNGLAWQKLAPLYVPEILPYVTILAPLFDHYSMTSRHKDSRFPTQWKLWKSHAPFWQLCVFRLSRVFPKASQPMPRRLFSLLHTNMYCKSFQFSTFNIQLWNHITTCIEKLKLSLFILE